MIGRAGRPLAFGFGFEVGSNFSRDQFLNSPVAASPFSLILSSTSNGAPFSPSLLSAVD